MSVTEPRSSANTQQPNALLQQLQLRNLVYQHSPGIEESFAKGTTVYWGIDPTGDSLHVGHFLGVTTMKRLYEAGQNIVILVGGGTAMIGDPGGKDAERPILPPEQIEENKLRLKKQLERFFPFADGKAEVTVRMVDNADWLNELKLIPFLRDAGKYTTVNSMIDKDSVSSRITREEGISYAEFSYQLLQAYDFMELYQRYDCAVQIGGSDQWGNIIQGVELIRKRLGKQAFALSFPLIVNPKTGKKFGKTETGEAIWLDPKKTQPYDFYQFFLNTDDELAPVLMRYFSFSPLSEIDELVEEWEQARHERALQRELAFEMTALVHGTEEASRVARVTQTIESVYKNQAAEITPELFDEVFSVVDSYVDERINPGLIDQKQDLYQVAASSGVTSSLGEARRLDQQNGLKFMPIDDIRAILKRGSKKVVFLRRSKP